MRAKVCILVHGGAGDLHVDTDVTASRLGALAAARAGHHVLTAGGSAIDAVEAAVRALEDNAEFNAGVGSALTSAGTAELDASIMDGATGKSGAVGCVQTIRNPVSLARAVMEKTSHILLVGPGAELFAQEMKVPQIENSQLITPRAHARLAAHRGSHGTVGAVALDAKGHVAAATSTGGTMGKRPGRLGDSPLIGCGTFADDASGAASATGHGESIIQAGLTRYALGLVSAGKSPREAAHGAVARLRELGQTGGLILLTPRAELAWAFNTGHMPYAWVDADGNEGMGNDNREGP